MYFVGFYGQRNQRLLHAVLSNITDLMHILYNLWKRYAVLQFPSIQAICVGLLTVLYEYITAE